MSRHYSDHDSAEPGLDPQRHRREIELMEQRFRQRSDRAGTPSTSAGVDDQVQEEMREFFSESAQRLEAVVPNLKDPGAADAVETTGEIRRKIDAFFGGDDDEPSLDASGIRIQSRPVLETSEPAPEPAAPPPAAPERSWAIPSAGGRDRQTSAFAESSRDRSPGVRRSPPQPPRREPPRPSAPAADGKAKMDLKTALERLRKHGVVRDDAELSDSPSVEAARDTVRRSVTAIRESVRAPVLPARERTSPVDFPGDVVTRVPHGGMHDDGADDFAPRLEPLPESAPESEGFDEIFAEVEGLVLGTLRDSVEETFGEARVAEEELRSATLSPAPASRPAPAQPPALAAPPTPVAASQFLPRPSDDDEEDEELEEAPLAPYDWGIQASERPPGAWLLQDGAEDAARAAAAQRTGDQSAYSESPSDRSVRDEPVAPVRRQRSLDQDVSVPLPPLGGMGDSGGAGLGARGLLARQLENEARRFQPCIDRLVERGVLHASDVEEEADEDDEVSVASFKDNRPRGDDVGMTPMRIVEEIRRLRRVQDALIRKGILTEDEIASTTHGG